MKTISKKLFMWGIVTLFILSVVLIPLIKHQIISHSKEVSFGEKKVLHIKLPLYGITSHTVEAHIPDAPNSNWFYKTIEVPEGMAVSKISVSVEGAPKEIIHHLSLGSVGKSDIVCGNTTHANIKEYFTISRTNIHEEVVFPVGYMLPIVAGENLQLEVMTHILDKPYGPSEEGYHDAAVNVTLEYESLAKSSKTPLEFIRLRLDDTPCAEPAAHQAYKVPAHSGIMKKFSDNGVSDTYTFPQAGTILNRNANVWGNKGGKSVTFLLNGKTIDVFNVRQGTDPWIWNIDQKTDAVTVAAGDTVTLEAVYENNESYDILDASGMFGFYFAKQ